MSTTTSSTAAASENSSTSSTHAPSSKTFPGGGIISTARHGAAPSSRRTSPNEINAQCAKSSPRARRPRSFARLHVTAAVAPPARDARARTLNSTMNEAAAVGGMAAMPRLSHTRLAAPTGAGAGRISSAPRVARRHARTATKGDASPPAGRRTRSARASIAAPPLTVPLGTGRSGVDGTARGGEGVNAAGATGRNTTPEYGVGARGESLLRRAAAVSPATSEMSSSYLSERAADLGHAETSTATVSFSSTATVSFSSTAAMGLGGALASSSFASSAAVSPPLARQLSPGARVADRDAGGRSNVHTSTSSS